MVLDSATPNHCDVEAPCGVVCVPGKDASLKARMDDVCVCGQEEGVGVLRRARKKRDP